MSDAALTPNARLVEDHCRDLWRRAAPNGDAEDHAQEALLRALTSAPKQVRKPTAFLKRVFRNVAIDAARRGQREQRGLAALPATALFADKAPSSEAIVSSREELQIVILAIAELPPRCRQCFVMRRFDDLNQHEVARRMGISVNMVEKHLRRAVLHCAMRLREAR